ncbi:MAG: ferrous iron transport protein B, partial [Calditrichota bacterium]
RDGWFRRNGRLFQITDLPGMYSLSAESPDEEVARDFILRGGAEKRRPDLIIQVIDGGRLERSLLLTNQLIEQDIPLIIALNMYDEVQRRGVLIDPRRLSEKLGVPVIPTVGNRSIGMTELQETIELLLDHPADYKPQHVTFDPQTERLKANILQACSESGEPINSGMALGLMMEDASAAEGLSAPTLEKIKSLIRQTEPPLGSSWTDAVTHARYAAISKLLTEVVGPVKHDQRSDLTFRLDSILLHRVWGLPLFLLLMLILFELTFTLGAIPAGLIDAGVTGLREAVSETLPAGFIRGLLADGIIAGGGMVLVFLPNIIILLMGIHLLEDSGYMARSAFLMDRIMRLMGLHGKAFIPLIMGFGCSVPALLASRTLESRRDRLLTMLLTPLMSCSARLPVYVMVSAAFFPRHGGLVIFGLYALGSVVAIGLGRLFGKTVLKGQTVPFIMELPTYRWPTLKTTYTLFKWTIILYLKRIGRVVLVFAVGIWFLSNYPRTDSGNSTERFGQTSRLTAAEEASNGTFDATLKPLNPEGDAQPSTQRTYIHQVGRFIKPALDPLDFTIEMDIALVSGFVAKEVVAATMGVLMAEHKETGEETLIEHLRRNIPSAASALAFLVFVLLYSPCLTTIVTLQREARHWYWTAFSIAYQTLAAWIGAFLTLHTAKLAGL